MYALRSDNICLMLNRFFASFINDEMEMTTAEKEKKHKLCAQSTQAGYRARTVNAQIALFIIRTTTKHKTKTKKSTSFL